MWSASEDGTLRQHDFRESTSCPPAGSAHQDCRSVLVIFKFGLHVDCFDILQIEALLNSSEFCSLTCEVEPKEH